MIGSAFGCAIYGAYSGFLIIGCGHV
jgi:hypothetical protein